MTINSIFKNKIVLYSILGVVGAAMVVIIYRHFFKSTTQGAKEYIDPENGQKSNGNITLPNGKVIKTPLDAKGQIRLAAFESLSELVNYNMLDNSIIAKEAAAQIEYVLAKNYGFGCDGVSERCEQLSILTQQPQDYIRAVQLAYKERTGKFIEDDLPQNWLSKKAQCTCSDNDTIVNTLKNLH